jgi:hypothetical protein
VDFDIAESSASPASTSTLPQAYLIMAWVGIILVPVCCCSLCIYRRCKRRHEASDQVS